MKDLRKLNVALAELVEHEKYLHDHNYETWSLYHIPDYSTDGNDMFELMKELKKELMFSRREKFVLYLQQYASEYLEFTIAANELIWFLTPEIVSKAAYRALTGEDWEG